MQSDNLRVAILYPGDGAARRSATPENNRFAELFSAFTARGIHAEPAVYHDEFFTQVHEQLRQVDGVLVWVNPIEGGRDRSVLDAMLGAVAAEGIFVSAHPEIVLKLGTKEVLFRTRELGWGCDTHLYSSMDQLRQDLPARLAAGNARVLKQYRGNGGNGVWKIQADLDRVVLDQQGRAPTAPMPETAVRVCHAKRGCTEEEMTLAAFFTLCEPYFVAGGRIIDQAYQERLTDGMIRCYLVHDKVAGFGHQAINALYPAPPGMPVSEAPQPGPRLYHPPDMPQSQVLKHKLEREWVPDMQRLLDIDTASLPILWDCDFLLGPPGDSGEDTYVLCEINVSSVAPYPESAVPAMIAATEIQLRSARQRRGSPPGR